jgi:hypothetical protein
MEAKLKAHRRENHVGPLSETAGGAAEGCHLGVDVDVEVTTVRACVSEYMAQLYNNDRFSM